jgi:hypothetical protein
VRVSLTSWSWHHELLFLAGVASDLGAAIIMIFRARDVIFLLWCSMAVMGT